MQNYIPIHYHLKEQHYGDGTIVREKDNKENCYCIACEKTIPFERKPILYHLQTEEHKISFNKLFDTKKVKLINYFENWHIIKDNKHDCSGYFAKSYDCLLCEKEYNEKNSLSIFEIVNHVLFFHS